MQISKMSKLSRLHHHNSRKCGSKVFGWRESATTRHPRRRGCLVAWYIKDVPFYYYNCDASTINNYILIPMTRPSRFYQLSRSVISYQECVPIDIILFAVEKRNKCLRKKVTKPTRCSVGYRGRKIIRDLCSLAYNK